MNRLTNPVVLLGVALFALLLSSVFFTVGEREMAIKTFLGNVSKSEYTPGLHMKIPFLETVHKFERRIQTLDVPPEPMLTSEKKNLIVDSFVKWRVNDTRLFFTSLTGDEGRANRRLTQFVREGIKDSVGQRTLLEVVSQERDTLMSEVQTKVAAQAARLGIKVEDVRIKKVELPDDVRESVYQRMVADREKIAREIRSEGQENAQKIRASAERIRAETLATAYAEAEQTRGNGDGEAARIYAEAYSSNRDFYNFYRSLNAYSTSFNGNNDILLLDPGSEFFKYFNNPSGAAVPARASQ